MSTVRRVAGLPNSKNVNRHNLVFSKEKTAILETFSVKHPNAHLWLTHFSEQYYGGHAWPGKKMSVS